MVAGRGLYIAGSGWKSRVRAGYACAGRKSRVRVSMLRVGKMILREIQVRFEVTE